MTAFSISVVLSTILFSVVLTYVILASKAPSIQWDPRKEGGHWAKTYEGLSEENRGVFDRLARQTGLIDSPEKNRTLFRDLYRKILLSKGFNPVEVDACVRGKSRGGLYLEDVDFESPKKPDAYIDDGKNGFWQAVWSGWDTEVSCNRNPFKRTHRYLKGGVIYRDGVWYITYRKAQSVFINGQDQYGSGRGETPLPFDDADIEIRAPRYYEGETEINLEPIAFLFRKTLNSGNAKHEGHYLYLELERDQKKQEILSAKESGWSRVEIKAMLLRNRPLKERPEVLYRWKHSRGTDHETLTRLATILPAGSPHRIAALAEIRRPWTGWSNWTVPSENTQGFVIGHSDLCLTGGALSWKRDYRVEVNGAPYVLGSKLPEAGFSLAVHDGDLEPLLCHVLFNRVESPLRDHAHNLEDSPSEQPPVEAGGGLGGQ